MSWRVGSGNDRRSDLKPGSPLAFKPVFGIPTPLLAPQLPRTVTLSQVTQNAMINTRWYNHVFINIPVSILPISHYQNKYHIYPLPKPLPEPSWFPSNELPVWEGGNRNSTWLELIWHWLGISSHSVVPCSRSRQCYGDTDATFTSGSHFVSTWPSKAFFLKNKSTVNWQAKQPAISISCVWLAKF